MFKLIIMNKRKPGMTFEAFREYYENHHAVLAQEMTPLMRGYRRIYLTPFQAGELAEAEAPFDCVAETWFDSEEDFRRTFEALMSNPQKMAALSADEENLFDRSKIRWFTAVECESDLQK